MTLCCQHRWYQQPVKDENAGKMTEASSVLAVRLPFYHFSLIPHTACAMVIQWCYILVLIFSKMFDTELCPLPFSMEEMFGFISCRFTGYPSSVQEQALLWLHVSVLFWQLVLKQVMILEKKKKKEALKIVPLFQGLYNLSALCLAPAHGWLVDKPWEALRY